MEDLGRKDGMGLSGIRVPVVEIEASTSIPKSKAPRWNATSSGISICGTSAISNREHNDGNALLLVYAHWMGETLSLKPWWHEWQDRSRV